MFLIGSFTVKYGKPILFKWLGIEIQSGKRAVSGSSRQSEGISKIKITLNLPSFCYTANVFLFQVLLHMGEHFSKDAVTVQYGKAKEPSVSMKEPGS